jgi:hypothetical protein
MGNVLNEIFKSIEQKKLFHLAKRSERLFPIYKVFMTTNVSKLNVQLAQRKYRLRK